MLSIRRFSWFLLLLSAGCATPQRSPAEAQTFSRELTFAARLDPAAFRTHYAFLSEEQFKAKLHAAMEQPLLFFRSFVNSYYSDLSYVWDRGGVGPLGMCLGDPHPENFGFIRFQDETRYVFNDLDDAGECPIAFDGLRYFTALRLMGAKNDLLEHAIDLYADLLRFRSEPRSLPQHLFPDLEKKRKKLLKEHVKDGTFIVSEELQPLTDLRLRGELKEALSRTFALKPKSVLDFANVVRERGGSAGLARYWALVDAKNQPPEVLELKARGRPGVRYGSWKSRELGYEELEKIAWQGQTALWSGALSADGKIFAARTRAKDSLNLNRLDPVELRQMIEAQVSILALQHRPYLTGELPGLKTWIRSNSATLETRYRIAYEALRRGE